MNRRIISALIVFLLLTSVAMPAASAQAAPMVGIGIVAVPETAEIVITGIVVVTSEITALKIAENLGKTWDNTKKGWDQLMKDISSALDKLFLAKKWINVTSPEGKAVMKVVYELYAAGGSSGGKKDDKWYFEARLHRGKIEINTERMNEEQAVKEMGRGKNIMTIDEGLAKEIVNKFNKDPLNTKVEIEQHSRGKYGKERYFDHGNFVAKNQRCHVWVWRP